MPTGASGTVTDGRVLLLGALDALLDLAHVVEILGQAALIAPAETRLQFAHVVAHRVEDAAVGLHARPDAARPCRRGRRCRSNIVRGLISIGSGVVAFAHDVVLM